MSQDKSKALDAGEEGSASESKEANGLSEAIELARRTIKAAAPVSVAFGTTVPLLYCLRIGYLPIDGLESIATLGATVALAAGIFLVSFLLLLAVPIGIAHWGVNGQVKDELTNWFLVREKKSEGSSKKAPSPSFLKIQALNISVSASSWIAVLFYATGSAKAASSPSYFWHLGFLVSLVVPCWYVLTGGGPGKWIWAASMRFVGVIAWAGANVYALFPVLLWPSFAGLELEGARFEFAYIAISGLLLWFLYGTHLAVQLNPSSKKDTPWKISLIFSGLLALIVVPITILQPRFHDWLMSRASVRMENVQLALKPDACSTLRASGIVVSKSASAEKEDEKVVGCMLTEATVLLRIGDRWPVSICEQAGTNGVLRRFTVSSDDVASWATLSKPLANSQSAVAARKMCGM